MLNRRPFTFILLLFSTFILSAPLTACGTKVPKRNFNELIPRFMNALKPGKTPEDAAANLFNVTSPDERRDAIAYLETQKYGHEPAYLRAYEILTADPNPMVRAQALRALGSSENPAIVPYLLHGANGKSGMADADPDVRRDAAQALGKTFSLVAIPVVISHLASDPDDQVRISCARNLRFTGDPRAIRALISALDDKNPAVVYWAHESLMTRTQNYFDFDPKTWLSWYQQTYEKPTTRPSPS